MPRIGASVSSYLGPQVVGLLRDATGSFTAGWYLMAAIQLAAIVAVVRLKVK